jgi:hypothetical protein
MAYAAGAMPTIHDEHINANFFAGHIGTEIALLTEASERSQSLSVAGTDSIHAQAVLYATADEPLWVKTSMQPVYLGSRWPILPACACKIFYAGY